MGVKVTEVPKLVIEGITDPTTIVCISRSRKFSQYKKAIADALGGVCPFCQIDWTYNDLITENAHWYAWHSNPPEKNTMHHFLYVPKRHILDTNELINAEVLALWGENGIRHQVRKRFQASSCGTMIRDGDATMGAGTVQHLHVHDMVPDGRGRVESPIYKGLESDIESVRRAVVFEKLRQDWERTDLTPEELELINGRLD